jgi:ProP effector
MSMTSTLSETALSPVDTTPPADQAPAKPGRQAVLPVLEQLFALYPHLFGADFLPLKRGIYQELLAKHPELFERDALKAALRVHTRSGRYLQCVASGKQRHDLDGLAVEAVAPEHVYLAHLELFRRRQARSKEDLRPKFRAQLMAAFEASGLTRQDYLAQLPTSDVDANVLLEEAFVEYEQKLAKQEALLKAFEASGKTLAEFADMYGMEQRELLSAIDRRRRMAAAASKA